MKKAISLALACLRWAVCLTGAAEAGFPNAYITLGYYYLYDLEDSKKAEEVFLKAAEEGEIQSYSSLGSMYLYSTREYKKAEEWLIKAAEAGDVSAYTTLGDYYCGAGGWPRGDINKAIEWGCEY